MTVNTDTETLEFQAEVNQLLKLMIHSLYSNKEIFLRELVSNASDACDKLRFAALADDSLYDGDSDLKIRIDFDREARTVTVSDNGIGMNREEVIANIGTIARSGTQQFLQSMTGDQAKDAHLIGQFGVGFYSSFIVADRVQLISRRAGEAANAAVSWTSEGVGTYTLEATERATHGTDVILHLNAEADEFLDDWRLRGIIKKYSDHITFPVVMKKPAVGEKDAAEGEAEESETVNSASALWRLPRKQITDDEYKAFYKHIAHDFEDPLVWTHNQVEGNLEYTSLFYIPARAPFDLWDRDHVHGIKLYVQRVFIMDDAEHLMPRYLRFVRGLVDSNDLPLNVSREILQSNKVIDSIRRASVKKVLGLLGDMAAKEPEQYQTVWQEFGQVLKEGPAEDTANRDELLPLLRFASTHVDKPEQTVSLADYVERMQEGQDSIYYITADSFTAAKNSPHLERLRSRGIEALLLYDRVDEWLMSYVTEFEGRKFVSAAKGELDLAGDEQKDSETEAAEESSKDLLERFQSVLGERVESVRASKRLERSPACLVLNEHDMALHMQALLKQAGHSVPGSKPILELNLTHPIVNLVGEQADEQKFTDWAGLLFDQALLAEGGQLEDPASFVLKLNELILALSQPAASTPAAD